MTFSVRAATPADHPVFARLFPELGVADPVATPEQFATRMLPRVTILEMDNEAVGYAFFQVYGRTTHVVHVVVDARVRSRGAGSALMADLRRRASSEGCTRWYLNVKQTNAEAIRLYERCGLAIEATGWATRTTWTDLAKLPSTAGSLVARAPEPDDDADLAARFDLCPERIALLRARPGVVLLLLLEAGEPVAFAAFNPAFPGVYPLRVARSDLARPLFDALRGHARVEHVNVVVEGDPDLFVRLQATGAELQHAFYRMGASL